MLGNPIDSASTVSLKSILIFQFPLPCVDPLNLLAEIFWSPFEVLSVCSLSYAASPLGLPSNSLTYQLHGFRLWMQYPKSSPNPESGTGHFSPHVNWDCKTEKVDIWGQARGSRLVCSESVCPFMWALIDLSGPGAGPMGHTFLQPLKLSYDSSCLYRESTLYLCSDAVTALS